MTWPLAYVGPLSVQSVMDSHGGWSADELSSLSQVLFNQHDPTRREGCNEGQVTWPDLQWALRSALTTSLGLDEWTNELNTTYPPLAPKIALRS